MALQCQDGDLAVITQDHPECEANIGRLVRVRGPVRSVDGRLCWSVQPVSQAPYVVREADGSVTHIGAAGVRGVTGAYGRGGVVHPDEWLIPTHSNPAQPAQQATSPGGSPVPALVRTLTRSNDFLSTLEVRPVAALPGHAEVQVFSQWLRARQPEARQVRWQAVVALADLQLLAEGLAGFVQAQAQAPESSVQSPG